MRVRRALLVSALVLTCVFPLLCQAGEQWRTPKAATDARIGVALVITEHANAIDFSGPAEVFQDVSVPVQVDGKQVMASPFRVYTVGESRKPVKVGSGLTVVPEYTFDDAPPAQIVVVGAQMGSPRMLEWVGKVGRDAKTDVLMSVCTGAFKLAAAGLLDGKHATTHHDFFDKFAKQHPKVTLDRGARFVQSDDRIFTAGGLTSGVDLALHIVSLYYGKDVALQTAKYMEYTPAVSSGLADGVAKD
ncbi:MAG: DJ-1/PfpI family protein [Luteimonas sp.]|nr:DJ-1/PfpI family protein [Luteimonas sp.]